MNWKIIALIAGSAFVLLFLVIKRKSVSYHFKWFKYNIKDQLRDKRIVRQSKRRKKKQPERFYLKNGVFHYAGEPVTYEEDLMLKEQMRKKKKRKKKKK